MSRKADTPELDLFSVGRYPLAAGYKEKGGTSQEAAEKIEAKGRANKLLTQCRNVFDTGFVGTADELAERLGESVLSIRPRVSQLKTLGEIEKTGDRHRNQSGAPAQCWRKTAQVRRSA